MEEFKSQPDDRIEQRAQLVLNVLGLSWKDLEGKKVLDVGAHTAELASAAARHGVEMVPIDMDKPPADVPENARGRYVVADARKLPFSDGAFDIALSHAALHIEPEVPESIGTIEEVMRVVSGEVRIAPLFVPEGSDPNTLPAFAFLKQRYPQAEIHLSAPHTNTRGTAGYHRAYVRIARISQPT